MLTHCEFKHRFSIHPTLDGFFTAVLNLAGPLSTQDLEALLKKKT